MMKKLELAQRVELLKNEEGAIGYIVAWLLGVPASILLLIFLIRG
jgi:hypothetical protein